MFKSLIKINLVVYKCFLCEIVNHVENAEQFGLLKNRKKIIYDGES